MIHTPDVLQQALARDIEQRIIALLRYPLSQANIRQSRPNIGDGRFDSVRRQYVNREASERTA